MRTVSCVTWRLRLEGSGRAIAWHLELMRLSRTRAAGIPLQTNMPSPGLRGSFWFGWRNVAPEPKVSSCTVN